MRLLREGAFHLLPVYALVMLSELGREGILHSGSFRFADHIYEGRPRGRFVIGRWIDALLLSLPSARSFRNRYRHIRDTVVEVVSNASGNVRLLSVPAGIPRDLVEAFEALRRLSPGVEKRLEMTALDLDPECLTQASRFFEAHSVRATIIEGDALDQTVTAGGFDFVTSAGFTEFLDDEDAVRFYRICFANLNSGGVLVTSATVRHPLSSYLMENVMELKAHYRDEDAVRALMSRTAFEDVQLTRDPVGYQVLIVARKSDADE